MNKFALALFIILFSVQIADATEYLQAVNGTTVRSENTTDTSTSSTSYVPVYVLSVPENISGDYAISVLANIVIYTGYIQVFKNGVAISSEYTVDGTNATRIFGITGQLNTTDLIEIRGKVSASSMSLYNSNIRYNYGSVPQITYPYTNNISASTTQNITWNITAPSHYQTSLTSDFSVLSLNTTTSNNYSGDVTFQGGLNYIRVRGYNTSNNSLTNWSDSIIFYALNNSSSTIPNSSICMVAATWVGITNESLDLIKYGLGTDCIEVGNVNPYASGDMDSFLYNVSQKNMTVFFTMQGDWLGVQYPYPNQFDPMINWTGTIIKNYSYANTSAQTAIANAELTRINEWSDYLNNTLIALSIDNEVWHHGNAPSGAWNEWDLYEYGDFGNDSRALFRDWIKSFRPSDRNVINYDNSYAANGNYIDGLQATHWMRKNITLDYTNVSDSWLEFYAWSETPASEYTVMVNNQYNHTLNTASLSTSQWVGTKVSLFIPANELVAGNNTFTFRRNVVPGAQMFLYYTPDILTERSQYSTDNATWAKEVTGELLVSLNTSNTSVSNIDLSGGYVANGNYIQDFNSIVPLYQYFYLMDTKTHSGYANISFWVINNSAVSNDYFRVNINGNIHTVSLNGMSTSQWTPTNYTLKVNYSELVRGRNEIKFTRADTNSFRNYIYYAQDASHCLYQNLSWYGSTESCGYIVNVDLVDGTDLTTWNERWNTSYNNYDDINSSNLTSATPAGCCNNNKYNFSADWLNFREYEFDWYYKNMYDLMKANSTGANFTINNYKNYFSFVQKNQITALEGVKSNGEFMSSTDVIETNVYTMDEIFRQELFLNRYRGNETVWITEANPYLWDANGSEDPSQPASDISKFLLGLKTLNPDKVYVFGWDWWEHSPLEFENIKNITTYYSDIPKLDEIDHYQYHLAFPYAYQYENDIVTAQSSANVEKIVRALGLPAVDGSYLEANATIDTTVESGDFIIIPDLPVKYFPAGYVYELAQNYPTSKIIWFISYNHSGITSGYEPYGIDDITRDDGAAQYLTINGSLSSEQYTKVIELNQYNGQGTCRANASDGKCVILERGNILMIGGGIDAEGNPTPAQSPELIDYLEDYLENTLINPSVYYRSNSGNVSYLFPDSNVSLSLNRGTQLEKIWHYNETKPSQYTVPYTVHANGTAITDFTAYEGDLYLFQKINASIVPNTGSIDLTVDAFNTTKFIFTVTGQDGATTMNITVNNSDPGFYVSNGDLALTKDGDVVNTSTASNHQITFTNVTLGGTYELTADTPPESITNLTNTTGYTYINWTWTNPPDSDFNYTEIYINNSLVANLSNTSYNLTGLTYSTTREISTRTVDTVGNINSSWVNQTATTEPAPAPIITSWNNNYTNNDTLSFQVNTTDTVNFSVIANQTITTWTWVRNGYSESNNYDNYSHMFLISNGTVNISLIGSNVNGSTQYINWSVYVYDNGSYIWPVEANTYIPYQNVTYGFSTTTQKEMNHLNWSDAYTHRWNESSAVTNQYVDYYINSSTLINPTGTFSLITNAMYNGNPAHNINVGIYNFTSSAYDLLTNSTNRYDSSTSFKYINFTGLNNTNYRNASGISIIRYNHSMAGVQTHKLYIDVTKITFDVVSWVDVYNIGWQYIMVNDSQTMSDYGTLTGAVWLSNWNSTSQAFESHKVGWPYRQSLSLTKGAGVLAKFSTNKTIDLVMNASYNWTVGLNMTLLGNEQIRTLGELNTSINSLGICQADKIYYVNPITQVEYIFTCGASGNTSISVPYGAAIWINSTSIFDRART